MEKQDTRPGSKPFDTIFFQILSGTNSSSCCTENIDNCEENRDLPHFRAYPQASSTQLFSKVQNVPSPVASPTAT